jgi:hypothetical protein
MPVAIPRAPVLASVASATSNTTSGQCADHDLTAGPSLASDGDTIDLGASVVSLAPGEIISKIREGYLADSCCEPLLTCPEKYGYTLVDDLLMRHADRSILVPDVPGLRAKVIAECHDALLSGHMGVTKTLARIQQVYYWPGMSRDVAGYIARCAKCQQHKHSNQKPAGLLKPLPVVGKGDMITLDLVGELPRSRNGKNCVMVVLDKMTKRVYYEACTTKVTAKQVAAMIFCRVVREQGLPLAIVSDRDSRFTSRLWKELWDLCGTSLNMATAYHQQSDGQSERQVRTLEENLRSFVNVAGNDWDDRLVHIEIAHNTSRQASTGFAPMKLHSGLDFRLPVSASLPVGVDRPRGSAAQVLKSMSDDLNVARESLTLAQARQKAAYDRTHRGVAYDIGDWVWLSKADTVRQSGGKTAWKPLFEGPYKVKAVSDDRLNLTLDIPGSRRHCVFHVGKVKRAEMPLNGEFPGLPVSSTRSRRAKSSGELGSASPLEHDDHIRDGDVDDEDVFVFAPAAVTDQVGESAFEIDPGDDAEASDTVSSSSEDESDDNGPASEYDSGSQQQIPGVAGLRRSVRERRFPERYVHGTGRLGDQLGFSVA